MSYNLEQLIWLFFIYSFAGWCGEVAAAAIRKHRFVNRGFVSGPVCPVYGFGAAAVAMFLPELEHNLFFLFLGGMIVTTFVEYLTGRLMEKIFHRKWWDYSDQRFNLDGYVGLQTSILWGICSVLMIRVFNPLLCSLLSMLPDIIRTILLWAAVILILIDISGSSVAILGLKKKESGIQQITEELQKTSKLLENALTRRIQRRMVRAFPNLEAETDAEPETILRSEKAERFAEGCGFFKLGSIFIVSAFLGDIVETVFCFVVDGELMSRSSLVFGQFSIVWGLACVLLTWILFKYRDKSDRFIFLFGTVLGGAYEYICSVFTEIAFGTVFWDYSKIPFNLGGRINLLYCFFWGIAAVVWMKGLYPLLARWIERLPVRLGKILCILLLVFLLADMLVSSLALARYSERQMTNPSDTAIGRILDEYFPDEFIEHRYENLKLAE